MVFAYGYGIRCVRFWKLPFKKDTGEFKIGITFLCEYLDGEVMLSDEHSEYRWIDPQEFADLESIPSLHEEISRYGSLRQ